MLYTWQALGMVQRYIRFVTLNDVMRVHKAPLSEDLAEEQR